ncbi:MAG: hypothetical protein E7616_10275 [Ruminococcaceae bacterium]|nr:hypothetical protein [Oscillospiraceae bacterium]
MEKGTTIEKIYGSSFLNNESYDSFDDITVTNETTGKFLCEISGTKIVRRYYEGKFDEIGFIINDYCFRVGQFEFANTEKQKEFAKAFENEDDTIAMLDRIKALIPES